MPYALALAPIEAERTAYEVAFYNCQLPVPDLKRIAGYAGVDKSGVVVAPNHYNSTTYIAFNSIQSTLIKTKCSRRKAITHCFCEGCERSSKGYASVERSRMIVAPNSNYSTTCTTSFYYPI